MGAILGDYIAETELKVAGFKIGADDEKALIKALDRCFNYRITEIAVHKAYERLKLLFHSERQDR